MLSVFGASEYPVGLLPRVPPLACIAASLVFLAACGEDREGSVQESGGTGTVSTGKTGTSTATTTPSGPVVATVRVRETEFALDPQNPKVAKAGVVKFDVTNAGKVVHALEVEGHGGEVETEEIKPGGKATLEADLSEPGTYTWYCPVGDHEGRGMKGKITVAGGGSGASSGDHSGKGHDDSGRDRDDSGRGRDDAGRDDSGRDRSDGPSGY